MPQTNKQTQTGAIKIQTKQFFIEIAKIWFKLIGKSRFTD